MTQRRSRRWFLAPAAGTALATVLALPVAGATAGVAGPAAGPRSAASARAQVGPGPLPAGRLPFHRPSITTTPALNLAYRPARGDYVVRCSPGQPVRVSVAAAKGTWVSVDGRRWTSGQFTRRVSLGVDQSFQLLSGGHGTVHRASVRCLPSDFPGLRASGHGAAAFYTFDDGMGTGSPYAFVVDAYGTPLWWMKTPSRSPRTRFWSAAELADLGSRRTAAVSYQYRSSTVLLSLDGHVIRRLGGGLGLDPHDLEPAGNGTYWGLRTIPRDCPATPSQCVDMTKYGGTANDQLIDAQVVRFDRSGHVLWTWNTRPHIRLDETQRFLRLGYSTVHQRDGSWDLVHPNSVQAAGPHRVIFSARNVDAVYEINTTTKAIVWKLGGTHTPRSLKVVGDPVPGLTLGGQHDARLLPDGTLSVFDDATGLGRPARAVRYRIDVAHRTARVLESVTDTRVSRPSVCCGSARRLADGHWVVSWGGTQRLSEVTPSGRPVFTILVPKGTSVYRAQPISSRALSAAGLRHGMDAQHPR